MKPLTLLLLVGCTNGIVNDRLNVQSDGAVLPVEVHGNIDSGTLVIFESGGPSGPGIAERYVGYLPFKDTLEPHMAVAYYDRRGTGNATGDYGPEDQSIDQLLRDLEAIRRVLEDRYQPDSLVLMGHSFGTYSSAIYQLDSRPVDGWVTVSPAIIEGPDDFYVPWRRDFACRVAAQQNAAGQTQQLWRDVLGFCEDFPTIEPTWDTPEREELWGYLSRIEDRLEPWPGMNGLGLLGAVFGSHYNLIDSQMRANRVSGAIEAATGREDLLLEVGQLETPTLVITGEYDGTTPTELGQAVADETGGKLVEIVGGGHYPMTDDPESFGRAVRSFVDAL